MPISQGPLAVTEIDASRNLSCFPKAMYFIYDDEKAI